jgi:hypothetical protein
MEGQGQGGDFNGEHDAYGNAGVGLGNDGRTMDLFGAADASAGYNFGAGSTTVHHPQLHGGSSRYHDPQLELDHLDLNAGEEWRPEDTQQYAGHLRGDEDLMLPPVCVRRGGVSRSLNFRPPGQVGEAGGSGPASFDMWTASVGCDFVQPMSRPRSGGAAGSSHRRGRGRVRGQAFEGDLC